MKTLTEDEFDTQFTTIDSPTGETYWEYVDIQKEVTALPETAFIWTAIDGDDGSIWLNPGITAINRIGFIITEETPTEYITVHWFNPEDYN